MKKIFFIALLIAFSLPVVSQDMYYGAKAGTNVSHFMYDGAGDFFSENSYMKLSAHFGGFFEYFLDDYFALQPELLFNIKGANFDYPGLDDARSKYVFKYLSMPLLVKYYATKRLSVNLGVEPSYMLQAKNIMQHPDYQSNYGDEETSINLYEQFKPFDLGILAGAGYVFDSGIYLDIRYSLGMFDTFNMEEAPGKLRNGVFQLSAGFSLNY